MGMGEHRAVFDGGSAGLDLDLLGDADFTSPVPRQADHIVSTDSSLSVSPPPDTTDDEMEQADRARRAAKEGNAAGSTAKAPPETPVKPPPAKKRKLDSSPPWKSATTQTPTSFVVDGRRKSGRVNPIPIELAPPSMNGKKGSASQPTRQTRSSIAAKKDDKKAKPVPSKASTRTPAAQTSAASGSRRSGRTQDVKVTPTKSTRGNRGGARRAESPTPPPRATTGSKGLPSTRHSTSRTTASKAKTSPARTPVTYTGTRRTSARTATRAATEASTERATTGPYGRPRRLVFDSDGELEVEPDWVPPKIRIRFRRTPPLTITHPLHIPPKPEYESFAMFLDADDVAKTAEDLAAEMEEARQEAEIRQRVEDAIDNGVLAPERCSAFMPDEQPGPPRQYYFHDQMIAHALNFQKLMERERRHHMALAKKLAVACAQKVQESIPKTKEEIEEELAMEAYKLYREAVVVGIRNKWALITEEVHRRRRERAEELRQLQGKEQLNQMLEHSTRLLKVRARAASIATASELGEFEDGDDEDDGGGSDDASMADDSAEGEEGDEDNMSSSGSDEEEEGGDSDDDANLTVEQLRAKYAKVTEEVTENVMSDQDPVLSPMDMSDGEAEEGGHAERSLTHDGNEEDRPELEEVDDVLLDDDDESVEMDSEFDSSGSGFESESGDEEDESQHPGLLGFFGDMDNFVKQGATQKSEAVESNRIEELDEEEINEEELKEEDEEEYQAGEDVDDTPEGVVSSAKRDVPATDGVPAADSALATQNATPDEAMELDDDTSTSNSPARNKPSGSTTSHTTPQPNLDIKTPVPFLLRGTLREYQHYGLDWLAGLYSNKTNGILADEMGLGKTIQTIALIAHLACEKEIWGPHLIVVPTSVMLNWEMEFKKWAPGFKILTYYGSREQRAEKRKGWYDDNLWHVCITSYQLVLQDQVTFKRRNWHYLILDEAHNIKNFRSQRWQTLLNFKAEARLLITGTPLQNNLIELWSLLYFLMPSGASSSMPTGFANLKEFQEWFAHPVDQLIEGGREQMDDEARNTVTKLHRVLRPYLLRRLKADVEKQMPAKYEHVVYCRLSKRQRYLYDDFMSLSKTRETLASGNYLSIINCLMQLRKVCNHPDLFETRQIVTSLAMSRSVVADFEIKELLVRRKMLKEGPFERLDLDFLNLLPAGDDPIISRYTARTLHELNDTRSLKNYIKEEATKIDIHMQPEYHNAAAYTKYRENVAKMSVLERLKHCVYINDFRCDKKPIYGTDLIEICKTNIGPLRTRPIPRAKTTETFLNTSKIIRSMILTVDERADQMAMLVDKFGCVTPAVVCTDLAPLALTPLGMEVVERSRTDCPSDPFHHARIRLSIAFPDKRLLQYDCGKLQRLDLLLRELQAGGHRALIFTQMTKVLDILEQFLNIHGHRYLRLDGSTKVEQRQILTERFNNDQRILVFILSTRSGGLGINLTGADTVIFYDLDWNPAMDKQCQDRCHRIGQTRDVHIYRFVSEYTIESNILRKSEQKRMLDDVVIQEGDFTTDYFERLTLKEMLGDDVLGKLTEESGGKNLFDHEDTVVAKIGKGGKREMEKALEMAEDVEDVVAAKAAQRELVDVDGADFGDARAGGAGGNLNATTTATTTTATGTANTNTANTPITQTPQPQNNGDGNEDEDDGATAAGADEHQHPQEQEEEEEDVGHVDDWMIKYMDWEVDTLPVLPASKDSKKRRRERSKKGKMYK